ncbi:uncharacterized protein N7511_005022 [Penicillium nucicola]|uniref:uncharacterized protein n=1 Tax=Penicillium nucicola TaxID=1850975 RepID=UPI002544EE0B|nr:uncharacterized protein N7511_005022 [Penicillium nucicola]KAJ5767406.1 hypothetical protein N7511_005022 [Penicillium nucicola]
MRWECNPLYTLVIVVIACGGIPKGYDEGGYSGSITLSSFKADFNLVPADWAGNASGLANRKANITSFNVLGAALGALIVLDLNDRLGRLVAWRLACVVWASGTLVQIFSSGIYGLLLFSRIWGGLGAGGLTVTSPLYLSEIAPSKTRGRVVGLYMVLLLASLALGESGPGCNVPVTSNLAASLGFFINYGASVHMAVTRTQYRLVQAIVLVPVGIAFGLSYLCPESPRYLASKKRYQSGLEALARLRGKDTGDPGVIEEFETIDAQVREQASDLASVSHWAIFKETQSNPNYRQRFWLLMTMQTIAQWTGGNGITYYYAGLAGTAESLISSGAYGVTKLVFTVAFSWGLIDLIGRRRCALAGLTLQLLAHIYTGIYMGLRPGSAHNQNASNAAIASVFVYAVGWSIGLCTIPYLYGTEIFPTRIRNLSYASSMALHWVFQFAVVRVTGQMFVSLDVWGAYLFWALICFFGIIILGIWMPETKGVPIERMGDLFDGPWYCRWRAKPRECVAVPSTPTAMETVASKDKCPKSCESLL